MRQKLYPLYLILLSALFSPAASNAQVQVITTVAGNGYGAGTGTGDYLGDNGIAVNASLNSCTGVTVDGAGNIYIADMSNNVVRKVNTAGIISTFAGKDTAGYSGNGGQATAAKLNRPMSVASDVAGNIYIADNGNNVVRVVSITGVITNYAGTNIAGYSGDGHAADSGKLNGPQGIAIDGVGNLFIADAGNNVIRKVDGSGMMSTVAGTGYSGYSGNGGDATVAKLNTPTGVAVDAYGNIYIADYVNNAVRKVDTNGIISTFAGTTIPGHVGDGGSAASAQLSYPASVSVDAGGNVFIADQGNSAIRKVTPGGVISRFAGTYTNGYTGDHGAAVSAELSSPKGVYVDGWNRVFIADYDNNVIRMVQSSLAVPAIAATASCGVYPNPSKGIFTVTMPSSGNATIVVTDILGKVVVNNTTATTNSAAIDMSNMPAGTYLLKVNAGDMTFREKISIVQ